MPESSDFASLTSEQLFEKARRTLAGGVSHESRFAAPYPTYTNRAQGSKKWDVEGREYVDYAMGSASLLLGHSHPDVTAAVTEQVAMGTFYADCHPLEVEWAALVQELIPSAERVRFVGSGTEATMLAIRLGRAYSGKPKVLRFEGHYHGWHDYVAVGMTAPFDRIPSLGILPGAAEATVVVAPDADKVEAALRRDSEIGTIICEVSGANYGSVPMPDGFLKDLRRLADEHGVVLIFDEVITGFRWSPGGLQARDGIIPDLTTMAKVVTGGMPGGAVGGKEEIMRLLDPAVEFDGRKPAVTHKGTFNGNPLVAAAAVAALKVVRTGEPHRQADRIAGQLRQGMQKILDEHQVEGAVYGESSTFHVFFGKVPNGSVKGLSAAQIRALPKETVQAYRAGLRKRGVDNMSYLCGVTSLAHTDEDVARTLEAFEGTVQELIERGLIGRA